jgi:hypothetical protein
MNRRALAVGLFALVGSLFAGPNAFAQDEPPPLPGPVQAAVTAGTPAEATAEAAQRRQAGAAGAIVTERLLPKSDTSALSPEVAKLRRRLEGPKQGEGGIPANDGATLTTVNWTLSHAAAYDSEGELARPIVGPVKIGNAYFYAVRTDIRKLDAAEGKVLSRIRMPSEVTYLVAEGKDLLVGLRVEGGEDFETVVDSETMITPGRGPWERGVLGLRSALLDARNINEVSADPFSQEWSLGDRRSTAAELEERAERDPTNPFLHLVRGELLLANGQGDLAGQAFQAATQAAYGPWSDDLLLSSLLAKHDAASSRIAFGRAESKLKRSAVRSERAASLLLIASVTTGLNDAIREAVQSGDAQTVADLSSRFWTLFPKAEHSAGAWAGLSSWLARRGQELPAERADQAALIASRGPIARIFGAPTRADMALAWAAAIAIAVALASFLIGLRSAPSFRSFLPKPNIGDVLGLVLLLALTFPVLDSAGRHLAMIAQTATAPAALGMDAVASPEVKQWVEGLPESPARTKALEAIQVELDALAEGKPATGPGVPEALIEELMFSAANARKADPLAGLNMGPDVPRPPQLPRKGMALLISLIVMFLFMTAGGLLGRAAPENADFIRKWTPGGAKACSIFTGVTVAAFAFAVLSLAFGADVMLQSTTLASIGKYYGLEEVLRSGPSLARTWPLVALGCSLLMHWFTVTLSE